MISHKTAGAHPWRFEHKGFCGEWFDGAPLGNGDLGALMLSQHRNTLFRLAKSDVWDERCDDGTGRRASFYPFASFDKLRALIEKKEWDKIDRDFAERLRTWKGKFCLLPAGLLSLKTERFEKEIELLDFRQDFDLRTATANAFYSTRVRQQATEAFISSEHQVLAIHVRCKLDWRRGHPPRPMTFGMDVSFDLPARDANARITTGTQDGLLWRRLTGYHKVDYVTAILVQGRGLKITPEEKEARLVLEAPKEADFVLYVAIVSRRDVKREGDLLPEAIRRVKAAAAAGRGPIQKAHRRWWKNFWSASIIDIPEKDLLRQHNFGIYLLGSCSRRGFSMPGIHGLWTIQSQGSGWNEYTNDMNTQMTYWPAYATNHLELTWPQYETIHRWLPETRRYTRDYWGCGGVQFSCAVSPEGIVPPAYLPTMHWAGQSAFVVHNFWTHYEFSQDKDFLKRLGHPALKASAEFYLDFLRKGKDGRYEIWPSNTPELGEGSYEAWGKNPAFDIAVIRDLFHAVIRSCEILRCDADLARACRERLDHFPGYPMRAGGLIDMESKEFIYSHGHPGMLSAIYPCAGGLSRTAAIKSIDRFTGRGEHFWGGNTPGWLGPADARAGRGDKARDRMRHFIESYTPSGRGGLGLIYDYRRTGRGLSVGPAIFVLETTLCPSAILPEMLLQSHAGFLEVFPAVPRDWSDVSFENLRARGAFLVSAARRNGRVLRLELRSEAGGLIRLKNPWARLPRLHSGGASVTMHRRGNILEWTAQPGARYRLEDPRSGAQKFLAVKRSIAKKLPRRRTS